MTDAGARLPVCRPRAQQRETATLGMWVFLATEVLFFGALIAAYSTTGSGSALSSSPRRG